MSHFYLNIWPSLQSFSRKSQRAALKADCASRYDAGLGVRGYSFHPSPAFRWVLLAEGHFASHFHAKFLYCRHFGLRITPPYIFGQHQRWQTSALR